LIGIDTNILFHAYDASSPSHAAAVAFLESLYDRTDILISELVLVELYRLLRNSAVLKNPLSGTEAVAVISEYRSQTQWPVVGFPAIDSRQFHDRLWKIAGQPQFAYRRIYDARIAFSLQSVGATEFATCNAKDFLDLGFERVWDPLASKAT
jgi:predicted nucleic acid-binding protein